MSQSSYEKFLVDLEKQIRDVAMFESGVSETETLNVIKQSVNKTNLESLLNKFDEMRRNELEPRDRPAAESGAVSSASKSKKRAAAAASSAVADKKEGATRARKKTGYNIFVAEKVADGQNKMTMAKAAEVWRSLSEDEKKIYNQRASALTSDDN